MTTEKKQKVVEKDSIEENGEEDAEEEEYEGRQWNKMIIAVAFVLIVVVLWYIITSAV